VLNLPTPTSRILVVTGSAVNTIAVHASFGDLGIPTRTVTAGALNTAITAATTTAVVQAPGANVDRNVKFLSIQNTSALPCAVTVQQTSGPSTVTLFSVNLLAGFTLQYNTDSDGFRVYDTTGRILMGST
jgi:hypothetical protein